jgi:hypothetical protein
MRDAISSALLLYAPFDETADAVFAKGDASLYEATSIDHRSTAKSWTTGVLPIQLLSDGGRFSGCLRFERPSKEIVFFKANHNFPTFAESRSGTVSFWLNTDPIAELREGFCDPIQITSKQWDDAAFFVEFEKRGNKVPFRLGVYADKHVWNPDGTDFAAIPPEKRPLAAVENPPFQKGKWTHIAFTFSNFNSQKADATSKLYLDGSLVASLSPRLQTFTWDIDQAAIMLGLNYVGLMDDLAIFDRALEADEIQFVYHLPEGVGMLVPQTDK